MASIPASQLVNVQPGVVSAGGSPLSLNSVFLTKATQVPIGQVVSFANQAAVAAYFGPNSTEAAQATVYFNGFTGASLTPGALMFFQYADSAVAAYLRGLTTGLTLAQVQAVLPGVTTASIGGSVTASAGASFTATGSGTVLTISAVTGVVHAGDAISGTGVPAGTVIVSLGSSTGGAGTVNTNNACTSSGDALTSTSTVLDVTAVGSGTLQPTDVLSGSGVTGATAIVSQLTGSAGSTGTYRTNTAQRFASTTVTSLSTVMKVTAVASGALIPGQALTGSNVSASTRISSQLTGTTGSTGTYKLSVGSTAASTTMTGAHDMSVTIDGTPLTFSTINLSAATSLSDAAARIGTALSLSGGQTCTYDSTFGAFIVTSGTTGATSTLALATGFAATVFGLGTGATLSQGAAATTPAAAMAAITALTQNFATFMTMWEPVLATKLLFAVWANGQNARYAYVCWDTDTNAIVAGNTTCFGAVVNAGAYVGSIPVYLSEDKAALVCAITAAINFNQANGRITYAYKGQGGLLADVTDATIANTLIANGYNFYGSYATANQTFTGLQPGQISGVWKWIDSFINQIYLNSQLQLAGMTLLSNVNSLPYNADGYTAVRDTFSTPIKDAINFGSIRIGVQLSSTQAAQVNAAAGGITIDKVLTNTGYYLQVLPASSVQRGLRGTPPCNLWYMDGGSIQKLTLASYDVQ